MEKILVAGATGYLGRYLVKAFKEKGYYVRALVRNEKKLEDIKEYIDDIFIGEVTNKESIKGVHWAGSFICRDNQTKRWLYIYGC